MSPSSFSSLSKTLPYKNISELLKGTIGKNLQLLMENARID
jgi:hypothetical protein